MLTLLVSFQDAIRTLNTLQTNASYLEQVKRERGDPQVQLEAMKGFLERSGLKVRATRASRAPLEIPSCPVPSLVGRDGWKWVFALGRPGCEPSHRVGAAMCRN